MVAEIAVHLIPCTSAVGRTSSPRPPRTTKTTPGTTLVSRETGTRRRRAVILARLSVFAFRIKTAIEIQHCPLSQGRVEIEERSLVPFQVPYLGWTRRVVPRRYGFAFACRITVALRKDDVTEPPRPYSGLSPVAQWRLWSRDAQLGKLGLRSGDNEGCVLQPRGSTFQCGLIRRGEACRSSSWRATRYTAMRTRQQYCHDSGRVFKRETGFSARGRHVLPRCYH